VTANTCMKYWSFREAKQADHQHNTTSNTADPVSPHHDDAAKTRTVETPVTCDT